MRTCRLGALLLLVCVLIPALATTPSPQAKSPLSTASPAPALAANSASSAEARIQATIAELEKQNALLKQQYELTRGFQSDVLTTVWASLSVLAAMTLGLIAFGWWTNFRLYERDKHSLLQELTNTTGTRVTRAEQALRSELQTERGRTDNVLEDIRVHIQQTRSTQLEAVDAAVLNLSRKLEKSIEDSKRASDRNIGYVALELTRFKINTAKKDKHWSLVLTLALEQVENASSMKDEWYAKVGLEALDQAMAGGGKFTKSEFEKAPDILGRVPERLDQIAAAIIAKLKDANVQES